MITDKLLIDAINLELARDYKVYDGRPLFRIVWSEFLYETRIGDFTDYYGSIIIREVHGVREVPKYKYFKAPCFVLEKLVFINRISELRELLKELPEAGNGSYECLYRFANMKTEEPLSVNRNVVEIILWTLMNPRKRLPSDLLEDMHKQEIAESAYFEEALGEGERSPLFTFQNSTFVSSNQILFKEKRHA